ncbi:MAG: FeoC-like transcriptional regulator [Gammaproteobacteria bacterium]|jgi:Mn-dependent DtxR family transcriptional regulator
MILTDIGNYLRERQCASVADIATRFDADPDAVRDMLARLVRKQRIHRVRNLSGCGSSCRKCDNAATELYAWGGPSEETPGQATCPDA